ncbi:hypothetical protein GQ457_17G006450 [Hibiscus cannabinus]
MYNGLGMICRLRFSPDQAGNSDVKAGIQAQNGSWINVTTIMFLVGLRLKEMIEVHYVDIRNRSFLDVACGVRYRYN